jgi:hypothetical protein
MFLHTQQVDESTGVAPTEGTPAVVPKSYKGTYKFVDITSADVDKGVFDTEPVLTVGKVRVCICNLYNMLHACCTLYCIHSVVCTVSKLQHDLLAYNSHAQYCTCETLHYTLYTMTTSTQEL